MDTAEIVNEGSCLQQLERPSILKRLRYKLFHSGKHGEIPSKLPAQFKDAIHTHTYVVFGFWDRVRVFFGANIEIRAMIGTENPPGNNSSIQSSSVLY